MEVSEKVEKLDYRVWFLCMLCVVEMRSAMGLGWGV